MDFGSLTDYFAKAAVKHLSVVDADSSKSNQHEIGGLPSAGFVGHLGAPGKSDEAKFPCMMVYISDEDADPDVVSDTVTWYDARRKNPTRSPEYRLYYKSNAVTSLIRPGDFMLIAKRTNGTLLIVFTPPHTAVEHQLRQLFGASKDIGSTFSSTDLRPVALHLPVRMLLEEIGVVVEPPHADDDSLLSQIIEKYGERFPSTSEFSGLARKLSPLNPREYPDETLLGWMEKEEQLFRLLERHIVQKRLFEGFGQDGGDVDAFITFSLSVQNRRKSRVGHAFENHLAFLFQSNELQFEQGKGSNITENQSRPDFLFPSFDAYHDPATDVSMLRLLGAKTTCKDRWRQVLSEGARIARKHLVTLEPGITEKQTSEMEAHNLQLVVPAPLLPSYTPAQRLALQTLSDFIKEAKSSTHAMSSVGSGLF